MMLVIYYSFFALIAIITNFLIQELSLLTYHGKYSLLISILCGTVVGLVVKFYLDKHFIFKYLTRSNGHNLKLFVLYSIMGGVTTIIFWGFELSFYYFFESTLMKYVGGGLGLILGYISKYFLDKKFVFTSDG
ncbi:GtrA family protein [Acinetobacter junii]|uniref:GtrA family protein n=1 Tax=Acinetobacter junii TaxID=40215 RepID=UPI0034CEDAA2